ncbi:unnamed protein product [Nippostrongylus brasiliensis]|uniref:Doublecortin domain-containing protein n=1 Tax=Nippostrongylus brasiliensis TaxID=27835 RepID=A0A0N4YAI3_NIPBR|nr:unnamed protein product [Nippostrongylus brasiliensis]
MRASTTCLLYKFVFKRYLDDSDFSNKQLECIHEEITNGVRLFARLKSHHRTIKIIHREQEMFNSAGTYAVLFFSDNMTCRTVNAVRRRVTYQSFEKFYCEVIPKPWSTPLYRFLFTDLSPEVAIPEEELVSIYNGLVEVARRLDKVRASRGLTYQAPEEPEEDNVCNPSSRSQSGSPVCHAGRMKAASSELSSQESTSHAAENLDSKSLGTRGQQADVPLDEFRKLSLEEGNKSRKNSDDENRNENTSPSIREGVSATPAAADSDEPAPSKEVLYARAKKQDGAKLRTSDSPFAVLDNTVKERGTGSQLAPINAAPKLRGSFRNRIRLTEFIKPYDGIKVSLLGSPSRKCDGKKLNRPLGVTFDEALEQWIVADTENNRVVMAPSGETLTSAQMIAPCAVAVIEPGHSFAVLTKYDIRIMYHRKDEWDLVVNHSGLLDSEPRIKRLTLKQLFEVVYKIGLAITDSGNLLTMEKIKGYWNINVYEAKNRATLVNSCPYPKTPNGLPSFLDVHRGFVIITDLGTQSIMRFSIELGSDKMGFQECVCLGTGPTNRGHIEIKYISGVFIDDDQNILVADAKGRSLQAGFMFNNRGIFLHAIKVTNGALPYISGIWVNKSGLIGACARAETNGGLYVYRIIMPPQSTHVPSLRR